MSEERKLVEQWIKQNPGLASGAMYAISGAEGTLRGGEPAYDIMFGGRKFKDFSRHPRQIVNTGRYSSDAAGAPQFLSTTYSGLQKRLGLPDFSPESQRIAAIAKIRERLKPIGGLAALTKAGTFTPEIQAALSPEWASFPTASGKSYYGQPVKKATDIQKFFEQGKQRVTQAPALPPATATTSNPREQGNGLGASVLNWVKNMKLGTIFQPQSSLPGYDEILNTIPDPQSYLQAFANRLMEEEEV